MLKICFFLVLFSFVFLFFFFFFLFFSFFSFFPLLFIVSFFFFSFRKCASSDFVGTWEGGIIANPDIGASNASLEP